MEKRVYYIKGLHNHTQNQFDTLEEAITACDKYNKKVKNKRFVCSGIYDGDGYYLEPRIEYKPN